jgi:hypothetical protein
MLQTEQQESKKKEEDSFTSAENNLLIRVPHCAKGPIDNQSLSTTFTVVQTF